MCISSQLRILNGRTLGDLSGCYTCHKHNGSSSVDYGIVSCDLLNLITNFQVHDHLSDFSDHNLISCRMKRINYKVIIDRNIEVATLPGRLEWDKDLFLRELESGNIQSDLTSFMKDSIVNINSSVSQFNNIIISRARRVLPNFHVENKRNSKKRKWYNASLKTLRSTLTNYGKLLGRNPYDKEYSVAIQHILA